MYASWFAELFDGCIHSCCCVKVEPGAMLFPAIFFEPTNKEVLQLELGRTKVRNLHSFFTIFLLLLLFIYIFIFI